jgi:hypothetical protein
MNNTTKRTTLAAAIILIFTAAALVVGTVGTFTTTTGQSAYAYSKKDNGKGNGNGNTVTIQKCKQLASESGWDNNQEQECQNLICTHPGNNATCVEEGAKTTTTAAAAQTRPSACEECFTSILPQRVINNILEHNGIIDPLSEFCQRISSGHPFEAVFRDEIREEGATPAQADELIACLKAAGIVFRPDGGI